MRNTSTTGAGVVVGGWIGAGKSMNMRRGGRKPGQWVEGLSSDALRDYRSAYGVSRSAMGKILAVSATTIQNWETGVAIPTRVNQVKLLEIIKAGPPPAQFAGRGALTTWRGLSHESAEAIGKITTAYMAGLAGSGCQVTQEKLCEIVRAVRSALT